MPETNEQIIEDFCAAWARRDAAELLAYFTDDAIYHNIPMGPMQGKEAIAAAFDMFVPTSQKIEWEMINIAAAGDVVFTERIDRFWMGNNTIELPVAGVFELRGGKIAAWRDYFDLATWTRQSGM